MTETKVLETGAAAGELRVEAIDSIGGMKRFFCVYFPRDWKLEDKAKWPLILFLHGVGELGTGSGDVNLIARSSLLNQAAKREQKFVIIAPQCRPEEKQRHGLGAWKSCSADILQILKHAESCWGVNLKKICLTGASLGGCGVWDLGASPPDEITWAALAPFAGKGDTAKLTSCWPRLCGLL